MSRFYHLTFIVALVFATNSLFAAGGDKTDSLMNILTHHLFKDENDHFEILCQIASGSQDADTIIKYSGEAIDLARKMKINPARPLIFRGIGLLNSGKLASALESFMKAAGYYKDSNSNKGLATAYMYISEAYNMQENHVNEIHYLKSAISLFRKENDSINLASAMHNLGYADYSIGNLDTALALFTSTGEIYQKMGYLNEYAYCVGNSGLVYSKKERYDKAEEYLLRAIDILTKLGDEYAITEYMIEYASILQHQGEISKAVHYASESYFTARKNNNVELERDAAWRLAELYGTQLRFDSAYHYQSLFITFNDSVKNYSNVQKMADLRTEFEVAKKQGEVDVLEKNRIIQRIVIVSLMVILLLAGALILLYYTSLKRLRRLTNILEERRVLLEKQSTELKELNRIKDKFFSVISHDLRGPISSIGGISSLIKESLEQKNPSMLNEITDYIDQTVFSLTGLLENLLNWAQNQQGKIPYNEEILDTKAIIQDVVKIFSTITIVKDIRVNLKLKNKLFIQGDRNSIMMIIRNLLSNSLKFTTSGGSVTVTTGVTSGGMAEIVIQDTGIGIPEDKLTWLFDFRENKSTYGTDKEKGVGLGLTLVYEFVKLNKGTIIVRSTVGKGTSFILHFFCTNSNIKP